MAISQGLQQFQNTLQKENAGRLGITIAFQKLYTTAVGESTGAMRIFRQALFGLGIGAVIAGIVLLISNWEKIKDAISGATDAMRENQRLMRCFHIPTFRLPSVPELSLGIRFRLMPVYAGHPLFLSSNQSRYLVSSQPSV